MNIALVFPAFIAGALTFFAPCTLPLVPAYLGFISGVSADDLQDPAKKKSAQRKIFLNGVLFMLGFSAVFIALGTAAGFFGQALVSHRLLLSRIGGIFVILFGLFMLNVLKIPFLAREVQLNVPAFFQRGKKTNSLILGAAFGLGWTPCVGPVLGSVLTLAATSATASQGAFLLSIFSLGLAIPFLAIAAGIGSASTRISKLNQYAGIVSVIGGLFLVFLGILLLTDKLGLWIASFYQAFRFINYERILDYL